MLLDEDGGPGDVAAGRLSGRGAVELGKREDELKKWAEARAYMFLPLDEPLQVATAEVLAAYPG